MNKYLKYLLYLLPIAIIIYLGRKKDQKTTCEASIDKLVPVEPPHSQDYAYKRSYLNPVDGTNHTCRANPKTIKCTSSCKTMHYKFPDCVYRQPKYVPLSEEDGKPSDTEYVIKKLNYY